jgi:hypothetical protein
MSKRRRFLITSFILTLGFVGIQFLDNQFRFWAIGALGLLTIVFFVWSLWEGLGRNMTLLSLILPALFTLGVGVFWFLLPSNIFARLPILIFYGIGIYVLYLYGSGYQNYRPSTGGEGSRFCTHLSNFIPYLRRNIIIKDSFADYRRFCSFLVLSSFPSGFLGRAFRKRIFKRNIYFINYFQFNYWRNCRRSFLLAGDRRGWFSFFNRGGLYASWFRTGEVGGQAF